MTLSFTIYDTADSERVIKDILRERSLDEKSFPPRLILSLISKAKDKLQQPDEFAAQAAAAGDYRLEKIAEVYAAYAQRCKAASAVDFDDIILLTVQLLQQYQDVREYYQEKFRYVMIDEVPGYEPPARSPGLASDGAAAEYLRGRRR